MRQPKIYLAGPDVFSRDAVAIGERKKELCRNYGITGLYPFDNEIVSDQNDTSMLIYEANAAMIKEADGAIVNLTPFRGPSADAGTIYELGMLVAFGKEVFAYSNSSETLLNRTRQTNQVTYDVDTKTWRDENDMSVEDFDNGDNLMIDAALKSAGRRIHRNAVAGPSRFSDLTGFIACLDEAKIFFDGLADRRFRAA